MNPRLLSYFLNLKIPRYGVWILSGMLVLGVCDAESVQNINTKSLLEKLESLKGIQKQANQQILKEGYRRVQEGASSPTAAWNLYLEAVQATRFTGKTGSAGSFQAWKKGEMEKRSSAAQQVIQYYLRYLALTIRKANGEKPELLVPDLNAYVRDLSNAFVGFAKDGTVKGDIMSLLSKGLEASVVVDYLGFGNRLSGLADWEMTPGNLVGIVGKSIRPALRATKNPILIQTWDWQIDLEGKKALVSGITLDQEQFKQQRLPLLLWQRAKDFEVVGPLQKAINEMLAVIQANPQHPDVGKWTSDLEALIKNASTSESSQSSEVAPDKASSEN